MEGLHLVSLGGCHEGVGLGGREHERAGGTAPLTAGGEVLDDGQRVGQRLARARAGAADQVLAGQGVGQALRLNGGGFRNTALSETLDALAAALAG